MFFQVIFLALIEPVAPLAHLPPTAFLAVSHAKRLKEKRSRKPAGWYDAFSEEESTYDEDADQGVLGINPTVKVRDGWNPNIGPHKIARGGTSAAWFHESPSAGATEAWQTHYPTLEGGLAGQAAPMELGTWWRGSGLSWNEAYVAPKPGHPNGRRDATWFDASVGQLDGFGRPKLPRAGTGKRYATWSEQSVNTTLTCKTPGCSATSTLQAFNGNHMQARRCKLNLAVHATDYDAADEYVEHISINGVNVSNGCWPEANGCTNAAKKSYYSCLLDLPLETVMPSSGTLNITAKISSTVDECADSTGNLLYAVAVVTCLIDQQDRSPINLQGSPASLGGIATGNLSAASFKNLGSMPAVASILAGIPGGIASLGNPDGLAALSALSGSMPPPVNGGLAVTGAGTYTGSICGHSLGDGNGNNLVQTDWCITIDQDGTAQYQALAPLSCSARGCEAFSEMNLNVSDLMKMQTCAMTVIINQTDYDNAESSEVVEYISADAQVLLSNSSLGAKNPCQQALDGKPMNASEIEYVALTEDVTSVASLGRVLVKAKISPLVDECPSNGYLFDARIQIDCTITIAGSSASGSAGNASSTSATSFLQGQLRGRMGATPPTTPW